MGSLNGDVMVRRNGRTTSQVSVYNYPEHLNPFYEDDQHKRLRFWKISKKDNEGRRNSFSIGNLKDMWAFKTFRMKKKSSTLGINKTSESPPLLRRDYAVDNGWNTFDHRLRASNTSSISGDSFQRNAIYRSSLQTLPTGNDRIGLNRNDGYRSTIQVPRSNPRYQQPQQQHLQQTMGVSQNRRSSQSSMVSSNPFESDDDDEHDNEDIKSIGMRNSINGSTTTLTSHTPRKKRRAPAPPPSSIHGRSSGAPIPTIRIDPSHDNAQDELHIKEDDIDIANLTAEIESFVKTKNNDDIEVTHEDEVQTTTVSTTTNSSAKKEEVAVQKVEVENETHEITNIPKDTSETVIITQDIHTLPNEIVKVNGQVKTETVTTAAKTTTTTEVTEPVEKETKVTHVSNEIERNIDESKEIKTNGAIPKKPTNSDSIINSIEEEQQSIATVADLCINETHAEESPKKPVPLKRQTRPEAEIGHVECIHVHVESPRAKPRNDHTNGLSSFKTTETVESPETITTKTPFILTSPPTTPRRNRPQAQNGDPVIKETVKIIGTSTINERNNELNIKEERINAKPEILVKPTLSPKPFTKELNGKVHGFAEIHKPMRKSNQNTHVRRTSRDGSISPPFVPEHKTKEEEEKINNTGNFRSNGGNEEGGEAIKPTVDNLKIVETTSSVASNGDFQSIEEENVKEIKHIRATSNSNSGSKAANRKEMQLRDDEYEFLYRSKPASQMEWKRSTLAPLETNIPPEKRKSVKDIIESINRSQRLLNAAANKDFTVLQNQNSTIKTPGNDSLTTHQSFLIHNNNNNNNNNNDLNENLKILDERQQEIQYFVEEMAPDPSTNIADSAGAANSPSPSPSNCNNECTGAQNLDNEEVFQKCKVKKEVYDYRETSPITSNLDWNPVPKPKRTKAAHE